MTTPKFYFSDEPTDPQDGRKCVFCGSGDLISGVKLLDRTYGAEEPITVGKDANPTALMFKGRERSHTTTLVCGSCGFVHLFATNTKVLRQVPG